MWEVHFKLSLVSSGFVNIQTFNFDIQSAYCREKRCSIHQVIYTWYSTNFTDYLSLLVAYWSPVLKSIIVWACFYLSEISAVADVGLTLERVHEREVHSQNIYSFCLCMWYRFCLLET